MPPSTAPRTMRAGAIAQLLSSTMRGDSDSDGADDSDAEYSTLPRPSSSSTSRSHTSRSATALISPRRRHQLQSSSSQHRPNSATLRCRVSGCTQKQCLDSVAGVCIAHAILYLPVQQLSTADVPQTLAAYQRKLRRQPKSPHLDSQQPPAHAIPPVLPSAPSYSRPSTAATSSSISSASTARSQSYRSYRRYDGYNDEERRKECEPHDYSTAKLPEFSHRLPTVADLRQEGLHAFTQQGRETAKRSKPNSRNNSRRGTATRGWSATAPVAGTAAAAAGRAAEPLPFSSTLLFHPRRTPAGLTLERSNNTVDAVRLFRQATHNRPHSAAATSASIASAFNAANSATMDSSTFPPTGSLPNTTLLSMTSSPSSTQVLPSTAQSPSPLQLLAPAHHVMKVLSAVEAQRLYRADLLARLMQRPPVSPLQPTRLARMERLFSYRPAYVKLRDRQLIRTHGEHAAILGVWRERKRRLTVWLPLRCASNELYRKRVVWSEEDSVRSRTGRLDEWMTGRLARHMADQRAGSKLGGRMQNQQQQRWQFSTTLAEDEDYGVDEPQLSITVLEPSPRSAAMTGAKLSARGNPRQMAPVPQLALPQLMS